MKDKSIKDAVHGYITIEEPFWRIIDTSVFQRLKWIEQTSYRPLFPSARHDRFIHSIGVFHLGRAAVEGFEKNANSSDRIYINQNRDSFLLACLLHDVGHAPFSHTSEDLYNYKFKIIDFDSLLIQMLMSEMKARLGESEYGVFELDYKLMVSTPKEAQESYHTIKKEPSRPPKEHEIMSCIIILKLFDRFSSFFDDPSKLDIDLIIRSIIGCTYTARGQGIDRSIGIRNCMIKMLNSDSIDVDKLDYIARDTLMTGYDNIVIDTDRLLSSITMVHEANDKMFHSAYKKSAISVIHNVITAKTLQAKWIVNHPIIVYDSKILRMSMLQSLKSYAEKLGYNSDDCIRKIFSPEALLEDGVDINGFNVSLLSDIDILYLLKQNMNLPLVREYFSRDLRRRPIWKSHEEFLHYLHSNIEIAQKNAEYIYTLLVPLISLSEYQELGEIIEINSELRKKVEKEVTKDKEYIISILNILEGFDKDNFDYVLLKANNKFEPKMDPETIYIRFNEEETDFASLSNLEKTAQSPKQYNYEFFYLYSRKKVDPRQMLTYLLSSAKSTLQIRE